VTARLLIVDDHPVFADALAERLAAEPDLDVVGVAATSEAADTLARTLDPDVALVDLELGLDDGLALVRRLRATGDRPAVVVVTGHGHERAATNAMRAGALAFVAKDAPVADLLAAVRAVGAGGGWLPGPLLPGVLRRLQDTTPEPAPDPISRLTTREREVLALLVAGLDRPAIGARLFLSPNTVRTHVQKVLHKLEVHSSIEAVGLALRHGVRAPGARPQG
jgi:DNA-binding NarL/FixJ family response regulator